MDTNEMLGKIKILKEKINYSGYSIQTFVILIKQHEYSPL